MRKKKNTVWLSIACAVKGLVFFVTMERNARIELGFAAAALVLGFIFHINSAEWLAIMGCIALVISLELVNTALEQLCDLVQPGFHPGIKTVKDLAAGAVLFASCCSLAAGLFIFLPYIIPFIIN